MALDPATAKLIAKIVISQITDEEKRQRLIIGIIICYIRRRKGKEGQITYIGVEE